MHRNMKVLGAALLAVFAFAAVAASAASAHKLMSEKASTDLTGTGGNAVIGAKGAALEVKCTSELLTASGVANETESLTFSPSYSGCTAEPLGTSPIDTSGCFFTFSGITTTSQDTNGNNRTTAPFAINCGTGVLKITAPGCTISIPTQSGLHGVNYDNEGTGTTRDVKITYAIDGISYTTPGGFSCTVLGLGVSGNDMFITGSNTVKGYEAGSAHNTNSHVGIKLE